LVSNNNNFLEQQVSHFWFPKCFSCY
jgi:hypothetical protein